MTKAKPTDKTVEEIRQEGFNEGLQKGRQEILDFLEYAYLSDPGRPDRGTPKAQAILEIADAASKHFQNKVNIKGKKTRR